MILYVLAAICGLTLLWFKTRKPVRSGKQLPGPSGVPILGCAFSLTPPRLLGKLAEYTEQYGSDFEFMALGNRFVVTNDLEVIQDALARRPKTFRRPNIFERPAKTLGFDAGLFMAEGHDWGRARRLTASAFSQQNLNALAKSISKVALAWVDRLKSMQSDEGTISGDGIQIFQMLTANVLIRSAFGDHAKGTYLDTKQFYYDMNLGFEFLTAKILWPSWEWTWKVVLPSPIKDRVKSAGDRITEACLHVIAKAQAACQIGKDSEIEGTFIKSLIKARDGAESDRNKLTDHELLAQIRTFLIAGSETISNTLAWILPYVYAREDLLQKLRDEVSEFLKSTGGRWPESLEEIRQLHWCEAVMRELLRLHSPAPCLFLQPNMAAELKNGVHLEPEDTLVLRCESNQYSSSKFERPAEFLPERWMQPHTQEQLDLVQLTFGGGPRLCPGMGLAYAEGTLAIALFIHHFDVDTVIDPARMTHIFNFLRKRVDRIPVTFHPRAI